MRGPGLLVANDGVFKEEHRLAIFQINLGTKGTDDRAIGRFGKGLKSVFAWCEAFFIAAQTDMTLGWPASSITDLFNPWHGWRHTDWDEEFELEAPAIAARAKKYVSKVYSGATPWLAFWFPLRHVSHKQDAEGDAEWIFEGTDMRLPGQDSEFMAKLATDLRSLAPSLVNLRHLKYITLSNSASAANPFAEWRMPDTSQRIPAPDDPEQLTPVAGETFFRNGTHGEELFRYSGLAGRLPSAVVSRLEEAQDWPRVVKRTKGRSMAGCRAKGKPHFATLITSSANGNLNHGSLEVRWCVFFPVGKQPLGTDHVKLANNPRQIVVNLHGFFFLDSERLRIMAWKPLSAPLYRFLARHASSGIESLRLGVPFCTCHALLRISQSSSRSHPSNAVNSWTPFDRPGYGLLSRWTCADLRLGARAGETGASLGNVFLP
jgi:hypothetical protein